MLCNRNAIIICVVFILFLLILALGTNFTIGFFVMKAEKDSELAAQDSELAQLQ